MLPVIGALRPWTDPTLLQLNRLPMHSPSNGFRRRSLDGSWSFELFDDPDRVPPAAVNDRPRRRAVDVAVPGNWTMQDLGPGQSDLPQYTNVQMPFPGPPPELPARNPTGVYRRTFTLPKSWLRQRTVLHVAGAESVHAVYVNGSFVGYGTDSRLPSEYDIADHVSAGENHLAIVVIRFSAHSYVEDQDQWWMAGLHRSVFVESRPRVSIGDVVVATSFDHEAGSGTVEATATIDFGGEPAPGWTVQTTLRGPNDKQVGRVQRGDVPHRHAVPYVFTGHDVTARWALARAQPWSAESPELYTVTVDLVDGSGRVRHTETRRAGVRTVEVRDRQLLVNGQPIWVFGVNRHDHHPDRGKAVTADDIRADLVAMRAHNISAIRTSHYPNDTSFYDLCDELGFYVIDEANIESHAYNASLCNDPRYRATWLDRGARMVQRDRNHACVIMWSLGNESGYGDHHEALAGWIRNTDPSRPLHYEDAVRNAGWTDGGPNVTDIVCPMYPTHADIREYGEEGVGERPLIMCEYSHAMGNSNGSLADYWDIITTTPGLQGGFLWEWKDHGLRQRLPDGSVRLAYGGQFGEELHDGNFVADGLMSAELVPHPAMREVAWVHRPVTVELVDDGLVVANRQSFTSLAWLTAEWELLVAGDVRDRGTLRPPRVGPHDEVAIAIPCDLPEGDSEVHLSVRWTMRRPSWFAPAGHLVAWDQVELRAASPAMPPRRSRRSAPGRRDELPVSPWSTPTLHLWRAPIDNDGFKLMSDLSRRIRVGGTSMARWEDQGVDRLRADELVDHRVETTITDAGARYVHAIDVPDELADLARVGVTFTLPGRFDRVRWFGRGPHENYPDRNRSAMLGIWEGGIDECPYLVPQEFGLRTDCRWFELHDSAGGEVVRVDAEFPSALHVSATHVTSADLFAAPTATELVPRDEVIVSLDVAHRGVGTASCGPDILPQYELPAGRFDAAYRLTHSR